MIMPSNPGKDLAGSQKEVMTDNFKVELLSSLHARSLSTQQGLAPDLVDSTLVSARTAKSLQQPGPGKGRRQFKEAATGKAAAEEAQFTGPQNLVVAGLPVIALNAGNVSKPSAEKDLQIPSNEDPASSETLCGQSPDHCASSDSSKASPDRAFIGKPESADESASPGAPTELLVDRRPPSTFAEETQIKLIPTRSESMTTDFDLAQSMPAQGGPSLSLRSEPAHSEALQSSAPPHWVANETRAAGEANETGSSPSSSRSPESRSTVRAPRPLIPSRIEQNSSNHSAKRTAGIFTGGSDTKPSTAPGLPANAEFALRDSSRTTEAREVAVLSDQASSDRSPKSAISNIFTELDSDTEHRLEKFISVKPKVAEGGFEDPDVGWITVRAHSDSAGTHAILAPGSIAASQLVSKDLPELAGFLSDRHIRLESLTVAAQHSDSAGAFTGGQEAQSQEQHKPHSFSQAQTRADKSIRTLGVTSSSMERLPSMQASDRSFISVIA